MEQVKIKSYWNRPGGKFGTILGLLGIGIIGFKLLPILTSIIWNTVNFGIAVGVGFLLFYLLFLDRRLMKRLFFLYEILMKKMVGFIQEIDPFIIAENRIDKARKDQKEMLDEATKLNTTVNNLKDQLRDTEKAAQASLEIMKGAQARGDNERAVLEDRKIRRAKEFANNIIPLIDKLANVHEYLLKLYKETGFKIEDLVDELKMQKATLIGLTSGGKALNSALSIINGDPDEYRLYEQSTENLKNSISERAAELTKGLYLTREFMKSIDYRNASYDENSLKLLNEYAGGIFLVPEDMKEKTPEFVKANSHSDLIK